MGTNPLPVLSEQRIANQTSKPLAIDMQNNHNIDVKKSTEGKIPMDQDTATKVKAFEYFTNHLVDWYKEQNHEQEFSDNDLSKLKVLKIHFFVCASRASEKEDGLLDVFDNFWAMPYGHVESDVYTWLDKLDYIRIDNYKLDIVKEYLDDYFLDLDSDIKKRIDESFVAVKSTNAKLVNYMAVDLVELSHTWYSWKSMYKLARSFKKYSMKIPKEIIKSENKIYSLKGV